MENCKTALIYLVIFGFMLYTTYAVTIIGYIEVKSRKTAFNIVFYLSMIGLFCFWDFRMIKLLIEVILG